MLRWSFWFFLLTFVAALLGFGNVAPTSVDVARVLFFVFFAAFLVTGIVGLARGGSAGGKSVANKA